MHVLRHVFLVNALKSLLIQGKGKGKGKAKMAVNADQSTANGNANDAAAESQVEKLRCLDVFAGCGGKLSRDFCNHREFHSMEFFAYNFQKQFFASSLSKRGFTCFFCKRVFG